MKLDLLARSFACKTPEKMDWRVEGNLAECHGCSASCGHGWPVEQGTPEEFKSDQPQQAELFPAL